MSSRDPIAYERFQQLVEIPMLVLSLAFVPIIAAPLVIELSESTLAALDALAWLIWAAFAAEYLILLYLVPNRLHMVRTHVLDLVIIVLPFLRPLRAVRALRVLRAISGLGRAGVAFRRVLTRPGLRSFLVVVGCVIAASAALVYAFERSHADSNFTSFPDALWALVTATTVGYGDYFPVTSEGRAVAVVLMLVGIGLLSVLTANIAAFFIEESSGELDEVPERLRRIEELLARQVVPLLDQPSSDLASAGDGER